MTREQFEERLFRALSAWFVGEFNSNGLTFAQWRNVAAKNSVNFSQCWHAILRYKRGVWQEPFSIYTFVENKLTGYEQALLVAWFDGEDPADWRSDRKKQEQPKEQPKVDPYAACRERRDANGQLIDQPRAVLYRPGWTGPMRDQVRELRVPGFDDPTGDDL